MHKHKRNVRPRFRDTAEMLVFIRAMIARSEVAISELDRKIEEEERKLEAEERKLEAEQRAFDDLKRSGINNKQTN